MKGEAPAVVDMLHVRFDEFELDQGNARLLRGGKPIALAPTPFELLCALARQPGGMLTKHMLLDTVWGHRFVTDSVLKGAISDIRIALGDDPRQPRFIETVPRRGYRFVGRPIAVQERASPAAGGATGADAAPAPMQRASAGFVGRTSQLATLRAAWNRANMGRRAIVWLAGEPGIGKTTLIEEFMAALGDVASARGQCVQSFGEGEPYHAVLEVLAELGRRDGTVASLLRAVAPTWLLQLPWLCTPEVRESLLRELVGVHPERMLREFGEFLDRYTERGPLLIVTEDLHWADRATTQLMDYIARRRGTARFMWLGSFRLTEVIAKDHPLSALRHELRLGGLGEEIVLDSFSESDTAAFLAERAPELARDEAFVRALHARAEGVPLFVASLVDEAIARARAGGATAALADMAVPQGLSSLIDHYLGRLDADRRTLLATAAVCGVEFRAETLGRALGLDPLEVADACDALVRDQSWLVPGADADPSDHVFAFRHALYRQALLDRAPPASRVDLHQRVARALEQDLTDGLTVATSELAAHFAEAREPLVALRYYADAAQVALQQLRPGECLALAGRGLDLARNVPASPERAAHEIALGTLRGIAAVHVLGAGEVAREAFERAAARLPEVPEHEMRGLLLHGFGFLLSLRGEYDAALLTAARAEALAEASGDALLLVAAGTVQGQVHMMQGRHEAARRALERVLPVVDSLADAAETRLLGFIADPQVTARAMLSLPLMQLGLVRKARAHLDAAHARARTLGQPMAHMVVLWFDALLETRLDNPVRVAALAADMQALVDTYALAQGRTACRWFAGWAEARRGRAREGFEHIRAAYEANLALGMRSGGTETLSYAAEALLAAGDVEGAARQLEEAFALADEIDERIFLPHLRLLEAEVARRRNAGDQADALVRAAIDEARTHDAPWPELIARIELAEQGRPSTEETAALAALVARLGEATGTTALDRAQAVLATRS